MSISYSSSGDVREILGNPSESEVSAIKISLGRKKATDLINIYLEKAYPGQVPIESSSDIPSIVNELASDLSVYYIKRDLHPGPLPLEDGVKSEYYDKSIDILKQIKDGEISLPEFTGKQGDTLLSSQSEFSPTFDEGPDLGWVVDSDKLENLSNSKD